MSDGKTDATRKKIKKMLEQAAQLVAVTKPKNLHKLAEKKHLKKKKKLNARRLWPQPSSLFSND